MKLLREVYLEVFATHEAAIHVEVGERNRAELLEVEVENLPQVSCYDSIETVLFT